MEKVLRLMADKSASDVYLSANSPILIRINGQILQLTDQVLTPSQIRQLLGELLTPQQFEEFDDTGELNLAIGLRGRRQLPHVGASASAARWRRCSATSPSTFRRWTRWPAARAVDAGAGKARPDPDGRRHRHWQEHHAGVDAGLAQPAGHGPHPDDRGPDRVPVQQQEVGGQPARGRAATRESLQIALKNALRQAPDCILIGEIRDRETMTSAIAYALSGHLVLATLHANNSYHALGRILSFYAPEARPALLADLAAGLRAVISQRLLRATSGGRVAAVEILLNTVLVAELIEKGDFAGVKEAMEKSLAEGSQTFEDDIARLITEGRGLARRRPGPRRFADQPDVAPAKRHDAGVQGLRAEGGARRRHLHRHHARRDASRIARDTARHAMSAARPFRRRSFPRAAKRPFVAAGDCLQGSGGPMNALRLTEALIARRSVTPDDGGCQALLGERLQARRFLSARRIVCGPADFRVTNLWALRQAVAPGRRWPSPATPTWCPPGRWSAGAATPSCRRHRDGHLYGRGAADMKTSIAAIVVAAEELLAAAPGPCAVRSPSC